MHITTREDDDEATQLLLDHGANPNVQDPDGNSPLHTICNQRDIQTATWLVKNNGRVLDNVQKETPALHELFFDQDEDEVKKLMEAICQSNHRREILEEILRKKNLLFRLVKEDKSELLSIVLKKLSQGEQEEYVNHIRDPADGNTCLHLASSNNSLRCTSILLEAGAKLKTNAIGLLPKIEDFFTEENDDLITPALVDGLVERVKAKQLDQGKALELLVDGRKIHFPQASRKNWGLIAEWKETGRRGGKVDFRHKVPRMSVDELQKMVDVARDGHWEKEKVSTLLCAEDRDGHVFLSRLDLTAQKDVATWDQEGINQIVHKISKELLQWIIRQANEGNWDNGGLGRSVCKESSGPKITLLWFDEETQKQLAVMDKAQTCQIVPWLGSNLQEWIYKEAIEGRWDQDLVFNVLQREEKEGAQMVSAKIAILGTLDVHSNSIGY